MSRPGCAPPDLGRPYGRWRVGWSLMSLARRNFHTSKTAKGKPADDNARGTRRARARVSVCRESAWKRMRSGDRPGLQNRRTAGNPVVGGFDPHSLPPSLGFPLLRSGFRLRAPAALTPAKRLNFKTGERQAILSPVGSTPTRFRQIWVPSLTLG